MGKMDFSMCQDWDINQTISNGSYERKQCVSGLQYGRHSAGQRWLHGCFVLALVFEVSIASRWS
jgi:hypothetical protein